MLSEPSPALVARLSRELALACDSAGTIAWADERAMRVLGAHPGVSFRSLAAPGDEDKATGLVAEACAREADSWELTVIVEGAATNVAFRGAPHAGGALLVGSLLSEDYGALLTELSATMSELAVLHRGAQAAEARYRGLFEAAVDAILLADREGHYVDANPAATELLGYTRDELRQKRVADVVTSGPQWAEAEYARFVREGGWRGELELQRKDGSTVPVESRASAVELPTGTVYISALRDISERRALERMQRDFIATVTHDLRSPLTSIKGFAQMMRRRGAYDEPTLDAIVTQARRLDRLIGDLLDVSAMESGQLELRWTGMDLVPLVRASAEQAQALTTKHTVRVEAPDRPLVGRWDRDRLEQVLENLLSNAIKYSPNGGEVLVRTQDLGLEARISVTDHGAGIPTDVLPRLFSRFYRAEATARDVQGLGLGLYISKSLVEAHGGRIWVESAPGCGSTFTLTLPHGEAEDS